MANDSKPQQQTPQAHTTPLWGKVTFSLPDRPIATKRGGRGIALFSVSLAGSGLMLDGVIWENRHENKETGKVSIDYDAGIPRALVVDKTNPAGVEALDTFRNHVGMEFDKWEPTIDLSSGKRIERAGRVTRLIGADGKVIRVAETPAPTTGKA